MKKTSNAQMLYKSDLTTKQLQKELMKGMKEAKKRMENLRKSGLSKSDFYQSNKKDFIDTPFGKIAKNETAFPFGNLNRLNTSKELAKVNRFLNSKSSTPKGLKKAEKDFIQAINENFGEEILNEKNVREFQKFMKMYKEKYAEQTNISSDKVVDAFKEAERLKISKKDMLENIELFIEKEEELSKMELEDVFEGGKIDRRRRFKLDDYLK